MTEIEIEVLVPVPPRATLQPHALSRRSRPGDEVTIGIIENGKTRALDLLELVVAGLAETVAVQDVMVVSHSASETVDEAAARQMAARAHLVLTGVGD